ncbi:MAG: beta-lactamase family protein [Victivallales bacterium]|nr:beta-lactamase family protein [Victivallales bacterium]
MKQDGQVKALLTQFEAMGIPSIDCVIYHKGQCVFRHQSGYSDEARTKPIDGSERYNIYSCSKLITCVAALQLVEKGGIGLDDAVYDYLPEWRHLQKKCGEELLPVETTMTVRHLFTMTAGLTYNCSSPNLQRGKEETHGVLPTREAMKYLACDPLIFEPGTSWNYSLCHDVLAAIVEVVSGMRFGSYVKANIFDRIGMDHSTFLLPDEELSTIAAQYRYDAETGTFNPCGPRVQICKLGTDYESGGGGCISTVNDYIKFLEALRDGELLLKRDTIAEMTRPQIAGKAQEVFKHPGYSYGLGVRCPMPDCGTFDYGWGGLAGAFLAVIPAFEATIYHVQHVLFSPSRKLRRKLVNAFIQDLL